MQTRCLYVGLIRRGEKNPKVHDWPELLLLVKTIARNDYPNSLDGSLWMVGIIIEWVSLPCSCTIKWWNEFHSIVSLDIEPDQILAV